MAERAISLFLAGDAMIVRPWSCVTDPRFLALVEQMRRADVAIVNLETVIHEFEHPAQSESGGTWAASPPQVAAELKWAGVDMVGNANNHATDYGPGGVLDTVRHAHEAGLVLSGSGPDLQFARAPQYFHGEGFTIGHVAMASSFIRHGRGSPSRADVPGRPGLNPLGLMSDRVLVTPPALQPLVRAARRRRGRRSGAPSERLFGTIFVPGATLRLERGRRPVEADAEANLAEIRRASSKADLAVVSIHAHRHGGWLPAFARRAIDDGADVVLAHGPHEVRGIGLYRGRPIFYGLGDFVFEPHAIRRFPAEAYEKFGVPAEAAPDELHARLAERPVQQQRENYEGAAALLRYEGQRLARIELLPVDLQFDAGPETRGRPRLADAALGRRIVARIAERSAVHGTRVTYDESRERGIVHIGG